MTEDHDRTSDHDARLFEAIVVPRYSAHFARPILDALPDPARMVLDVGCGTGHLSFEALARLGPRSRVIAIDPDAGLIDVAKRRGWDEIGRRLFFKAERIERMSFGEGVFDAVMANLVYASFEHRGQALSELRRVLVAGGRLLLTTPLRGSFALGLDLLGEVADAEADVAMAERVDAARSAQPTLETWRTSIESAGFVDVEVYRDPFFLPYRSAEELFTDRLMQLVAFPRWRAIASESEDEANARLDELRRRFEVYFAGGPFRFTVQAGFARANAPE